MWAVYLCGATDCFLTAMFLTKELAEQWARDNSRNPEGFQIQFFESPSDIDTTDTGWEE